MDAAWSSSSRPLRIVIFPWLAFGHLHPYLELAERLALRGHRVSFISTPRNIDRLPPLRPAAAPLIDLVALPLPHVDGLPDGAESTNSIPHEMLHLLFQAFDGLAAPFTEFLGATCADEGKRPDWIIVGMFHQWAAAAAAEHEVPCAMLQPTAAVLATWRPFNIWSSPESTTQGERPASVPHNEWEQGVLRVLQRYKQTRDICKILAIRSCVEWEGEIFTLVENWASLLGKPLVPVGLLPPPPDGGRSAGLSGEDTTMRWLDTQPPNSVVYVAMGSEVPLRVSQVHELALGLELAGVRFLWALRKPSGVLDDADILPPGFEDRTRNQGLVIMGWVPQMSVLAHGALGAFLTHCGQNSLIEGLLFGHPLIMLPIVGDQGPNARLMEGRKVGLQVPRDEKDEAFDRHGVASTVQAVMLDQEKRRVFAVNAKKMQEIVADEQLQDGYMDEFVQQLRSYATTSAAADT